MAKKKAYQPEVERIELRGHIIERRIVGDREELWIDGIRKRFLRSEQGYNLYDDAYRPPQPTLMEAARASFEQLPEDNDT